MNHHDPDRKLKDLEDDVEFLQGEISRLNAEFVMETNPSRRLQIRRIRKRPSSIFVLLLKH
jgi:hypothetical protein